MLVHQDDIKDLSSDDPVCKAIRERLRDEWRCDQNLLFHGLPEQRAQSALQTGLRSKAHYILRGGSYESGTAGGSVGISFAFNTYHHFGFRHGGRSDQKEGGILCFPLQGVLGPNRVLRVPRSEEDPYELLLLHRDVEQEESVLKAIMRGINFAFDSDPNAKNVDDLLSDIKAGKKKIGEAKQRAVNAIKTPQKLRLRINKYYWKMNGWSPTRRFEDVTVEDFPKDILQHYDDNELIHDYHQIVEEIVAALNEPLGRLVFKPPGILLRHAELPGSPSRLYAVSSGASVSREDAVLAVAAQTLLSYEYTPRSNTSGVSTTLHHGYLEVIYGLNRAVPRQYVSQYYYPSLVDDNGEVKSSLHEAVEDAVADDAYDTLWATAFDHTMHKKSYNRINLSVNGFKDVWLSTIETIRKLALDHIGSAQLEVNPTRCVALFPDDCDDATKALLREKKIPTLLYDANPDRVERKSRAHDERIFNQLVRLLDKAGLPYRATPMSDDEYKDWLRDCYLAPTKVNSGVVKDYERKSY